tara:strand:- start:20 stop:421 length:402 start_codon:yes stop_codon:yes gene_type:complete
VYYGSTGNDIKIRENKGHYNCSCKDFINPTMEVVEYIDDPKLRYERELYYIRNYPCINVCGKGFDIKTYHKEYGKRDYVMEKNRIKEQKRQERYNCPNCNRLTNDKHIKRHMKSSYCMSKGTSVLMGPSPKVG